MANNGATVPFGGDMGASLKAKRSSCDVLI